jgi:hypothetical protein
MRRAFLVTLFVQSAVIVACSAADIPVATNAGVSGSSGGVGSSGSSGSGGCSGTAPNCFGSDLQSCCGQDPAGVATCVGSQWKCGTAGAPGCNGMSCLGGGGGCIGTPPNCFGNDLTACCGQDPSGVATCQGGRWMCGSVAAPGCNGTSCFGGDGGANGCSPACGTNQVCISHQTIGGGQPFPDDAGNCPIGTVHAGDRCAPPPTYACGPYPSACGATLDCTCAASACGSFTMCTSTGPDLVNCVLAAP